MINDMADAGEPVAYSALADVYEWLMPDDLLEPLANADAFTCQIRHLSRGARILDCAAGTGQLAVGLACRGYDVLASDANPAMIGRIRELADRQGAELRTAVCTWPELDRAEWREYFDAVFCVGNSIAHAAGRRQRRTALTAMSGVLRGGGLLVLTSRNWERLRSTPPAFLATERIAVRGGLPGVVTYSWHIPDSWVEPHLVDITVTVTRSGTAVARTERLVFWPFSYDALVEDVNAAGLQLESSSFDPHEDRYMLTASRLSQDSARNRQWESA